MAKNSNLPIKVGSIVGVKVFYHPYTVHLGIVTHTNIWNPGGLIIQIPGKGTMECSFERCYNATEAERKEYFWLKLKHG